MKLVAALVLFASSLMSGCVMARPTGDNAARSDASGLRLYRTMHLEEQRPLGFIYPPQTYRNVYSTTTIDYYVGDVGAIVRGGSGAAPRAGFGLCIKKSNPDELRYYTTSTGGCLAFLPRHRVPEITYEPNR